MQHYTPLYTLLFFFFTPPVFGQEKGAIEFVKTNHNFGEIREEDGSVVYEFEFTNNGKAPLVISRVKASCGCTTPGWSTEPVLPGESGFVKAQYNPNNRPGSFRKSLTVTTNTDQAVTYLYISGNVIPKVKTIEEILRHKDGLVRIKSRSLNLGRITTEKILERSFEIYNESDSVVVSFSDQFDSPTFIKVSFVPQQLQPKEKGAMIISYDPVHDDNLGFNNHQISYQTDETADAKKVVNVLATIAEYFPPMTAEEIAQAPTLAIEDRLQDLGKVKQGEKAATTFKITNTGKSDLNIRKVISNCSCLVVQLEKSDLKPGESTFLKATFDSLRRRGNQTKSITIFSNDPKAPSQMATIKTSVVVEN